MDRCYLNLVAGSHNKNFVRSKKATGRTMSHKEVPIMMFWLRCLVSLTWGPYLSTAISSLRQSRQIDINIIDHDITSKLMDANFLLLASCFEERACAGLTCGCASSEGEL